MLRNYPIKTVIGFLVWLAGITAACLINYPVIRIFAYTSLIFYGVLQGWSIRETYMQELERRKGTAFLLKSSESKADLNLSESRSMAVRTAVYIMLTASIALGSWAVVYDGISIQLILAAVLAAGIFAAFRFDRLHELQTAREICSSTAVIYLFFILMLPLYFNLNLIAACIVAAILYLGSVGINVTPQKMPRLTLGDFKKMKELGGKTAIAAEKAFEWYEIYPYIAISYRKGRKLLGFINLFPLKDEPAEKLRKGTLQNADLNMGDIASLAVIKPSEKKSLYLSCIAVIDECRGRGVTDALIYEGLIQYEDFFDCFDKVYIDAVTDDGEKLAKRYGFTFLTGTDHESAIYEADFGNLIKSIMG